MTIFLTREETERVTGYKSKRHQKLWLKSRRISFTEDEDLAKVVDGNLDFLLCNSCADKPLQPYFWMRDNEDDTTPQPSTSTDAG